MAHGKIDKDYLSSKLILPIRVWYTDKLVALCMYILCKCSTRSMLFSLHEKSSIALFLQLNLV